MSSKPHEILSGSRSSLSTKMVAANNDCVAEHGLYGTHLDISDKLRTKIWEGKDVSLAELLMPKYEFQSAKSNITINLIKNKDQRLYKQLSIAEFITAFGKHKRVKCQN